MSIQTSDADLRAAQNPVTGLTITGLTTTQLDTYVFQNCNISGSANDSSHPVKALGSLTIDSGYISGAITTLNYEFQANNGSNSCTIASGTVAAADIEAYGIGGGFASVSFTTSQTAPVELSLTTGDDGSPYGTTMTCSAVANSAASVTLSVNPSTSNNANSNSISCVNATTIDASGFLGSGASNMGDGFGLSTGTPTTLIVASSISITGGSDSWNGSWTDATITNAILAAYVAGGGTSGTLTIQGASPTGTGITDKATLISNGISVTTN